PTLTRQQATRFPYTTLFRSGQDQDPLRDGQGADDALGALCLDDELGRDEADVEQQDAREQERRPVEAELTARLDRLRHPEPGTLDRKSTRLNSSHEWISYAV